MSTGALAGRGPPPASAQGRRLQDGPRLRVQGLSLALGVRGQRAGRVLSFGREEVEVAASVERGPMRRHAQCAGLPQQWGHTAAAPGSGDPTAALTISAFFLASHMSLVGQLDFQMQVGSL